DVDRQPFEVDEGGEVHRPAVVDVEADLVLAGAAIGRAVENWPGCAADPGQGQIIVTAAQSDIAGQGAARTEVEPLARVGADDAAASRILGEITVARAHLVNVVTGAEVDQGGGPLCPLGEMVIAIPEADGADDEALIDDGVRKGRADDRRMVVVGPADDAAEI